MSDESEQDTGAEASGAGVDPAAMGIALGGASRKQADAFLKMQEALIAKQSHHLDEQFKSLRLTIWEKRMGVLLRLATAAIGVAIAGFLAAFVWSAAHADGLIVESFSVPPDLAARGLTGEVVAGELLNNLSSIQSKTYSSRAASTFTTNWGNDIKVEIPETGVSVGEVNRYLRQWLGHETHISGAVFHTTAGIAVTAQVGSDAHARLDGSENELDSLLQKTAEAIYRATQPYRYAVYLRGTPRTDEAEAEFKAIIATGAEVDRPWALNGLGNLYNFQGDLERGLQLSRRAIAEQPNFYIGLNLLSNTEFYLQHDEAAFAAIRQALAAGPDPSVDKTTWTGSQQLLKSQFARLQGDYPGMLELSRAAGPRQPGDSRDLGGTFQVQAMFGMHDMAGFQSAMENFGSADGFAVQSTLVASELSAYAAEARWPELLARQKILEAALARRTPYASQYTSRNTWPFVAYALLMTGDAKGAHAMIDRTPADCSLCLRMRGRLDAREKNWDGADYWLTRAAQYAPSTPFPFRDWGQMLLQKGDPDAAIAKFTIANQKGPHFADPLEMWGEALMAKKQPDQALAKFAEAEKYAPNWGRLHLKWGEALGATGRKDEAQKQFALAAGLDLSAADKAELAAGRP